MKEYREGVKRRIPWFWAGCVGVLILGAGLLLFARTRQEEAFMQGFVPGMQTGFLAVMVVSCLLQATRSQRALKDEALLKRMYIAETDERNRLIRDKVGNTGFNTVMGLLMLATVVAGYFEKTIFLTLLATLLCTTLIKVGMKIYYGKRY